MADDDTAVGGSLASLNPEVKEVDLGDIDDAVKRYRADLRALDEKFGAAVKARRAAADLAHQGRKAAIADGAKREEESVRAFEAALRSALADFNAQLDTLTEEILRVRPVSRENAEAPPTKRAAYSDRTALLMAKLSLLAYDRFEDGPEREEILRRKLGAGDLTLDGMFSQGGTQGFVCHNEKLAVLVFRGTTDLVDWKTNLRSERVVIKNNNRRVRGHSGFVDAYLAAEAQILDLVSGIDYRLPLYIAGHSLGGALAVLASAAIPMEDELTADQIAAVYSFGAPRVGGGDFRDLIKVPHYRVFNPWDIVPSVPPVWFSFQHTGDIRFLARPDRAPLSRKSFFGGFMSLAVLRNLVLQFAGSQRTAVKQHDINKYVVKLEAIARARDRPIRPG